MTDKILKSVARKYGVNPQVILSPSKKAKYAAPKAEYKSMADLHKHFEKLEREEVRG